MNTRTLDEINARGGDDLMGIRMLTAALLFISLLSACNTMPYSYDTAVNNGDIVNLHGNIKNGERLEVFYQNKNHAGHN